MSKLYEEIIRAIDFTYELGKDSDENVVIVNFPTIAKAIEKIAINAQIELFKSLLSLINQGNNPEVLISNAIEELQKQLEQ